jgi:hypothetical protein
MWWIVVIISPDDYGFDHNGNRLYHEWMRRMGINHASIAQY